MKPGAIRTLIHGGTVVTASDSYQADVLVEDGKVALLGRALTVQADSSIDATGKLVVPGGIDVHTHLGTAVGLTPVADDFETGTRAAAFGGTTTIIDFAVQEKGGSLTDAVATWRAKADGKVLIDYALHVIVRELSESGLKEMERLAEDGVTSFKFFMAYSAYEVGDAAIFRALSTARRIGAMVCVHAENGPVIDTLTEQALGEGRTEPKWYAATRPAESEAEATHRACRLAQMADAPLYVVHLSAAQALEQVRWFRERGVMVYAETCPHYLFLSSELYDLPGFESAKYVVCPPLRPAWHQDELWRGLARGDLQVVSTDHCPWCFHAGFQGLPKQKELGVGDFSKIPPGMPGIETRMQLLFDGGVRAGRIDLTRWVDLTATAPARIFGLYPRKGTIAVGGDADLVVWDPDRPWTISAATHHMRVDYNPYEGRVGRGAPDVVMSRGEVIVRDDDCVAKVGRGTFLRRTPMRARSPSMSA